MASNNIGFEETEEILDMMGDPIKFSIIFELFRNPNSSPLEIKKKLRIKGSRIYYYLNPLRDAGLIEEIEKEKITSHLSRVKLKVSDRFLQALQVMKHDPNFGHRKAFHTFQLKFAIAQLQQQLRTLEKVPEKEFNQYIESLGLPHRQFFFLNKETLNQVNLVHRDLSNTLDKSQNESGGLLSTMRNAEYLTLFGVYKLE